MTISMALVHGSRENSALLVVLFLRNRSQYTTALLGHFGRDRAWAHDVLDLPHLYVAQAMRYLVSSSSRFGDIVPLEDWVFLEEPRRSGSEEVIHDFARHLHLVAFGCNVRVLIVVLGDNGSESFVARVC